MKRDTVVALRRPDTVDADGAAAAASNAIHHRQARRAMLEEFLARLYPRRIRATTRRRRAHDLVAAHVGRARVVSGHAATDVTLADNADQLAVFCILNYWRAAAACGAHGSRCMCRRVNHDGLV